MRPNPISKEQAMNKISEEVENWLERAIPIINERLENFYKGSCRNIEDSLTGLDKLSSESIRKAVDLIIDLYTAEGWTVRREYGNQREPGNWISFS